MCKNNALLENPLTVLRSPLRNWVSFPHQNWFRVKAYFKEPLFILRALKEPHKQKKIFQIKKNPETWVRFIPQAIMLFILGCIYISLFFSFSITARCLGCIFSSLMPVFLWSSTLKNRLLSAPGCDISVAPAFETKEFGIHWRTAKSL